jgi:hypothetical protein
MLATIRSRPFCLLVCCLKTKTGIYKYKTIILPLVLYGCETWSLTLREEHSLRVQNYWIFVLCPSSCILETRKHVSETGSVSVLR